MEFKERLTKTRTGETGSTHRHLQPKIFADGSARCPIEMYKKYRARRPIEMCETESPFYLSAKTKFRAKDQVWYAKQAMGKNTLGALMKMMAKNSGIPGKITNHSLRKTTCQTLLSKGVHATIVCQLTGHKTVNSLSNYTTANMKQQEEMSSLIKGNNVEEKAIIVPAKKPRIDSTLSQMASKTGGMLAGASIQANVNINVLYNFAEGSFPSSQLPLPPK